MRTYCIAQGTRLSVLWQPKWEGNPKKKEYMYMLADSLCCTVETNSVVKPLYSNKNEKKMQGVLFFFKRTMTWLIVPIRLGSNAF